MFKNNNQNQSTSVGAGYPVDMPWLCALAVWSGHSEAKLGGERSENGAGYYPLDTIHSIATHKFLVPHSVNRPTVVIEE